MENIGETIGATDVEIRARVQGFLESVNFEEGSFVSKGQLLYTIDPQQYEANLATARGQTAQAQLSKAQADVARYKLLVELNAISRQEYDTAVSAEEAAAAALEAATILLSFREVDDVLTTYNKSGQQRSVQGDRVKALEKVLLLADARYRGGVASYLEVLDAQRSLFDAQLNEVDSIRAHTSSLVRLYKALGGGWPYQPEASEPARQ